VIAIFVSNYLHCLVDLLHRYQTGELKCEIGLIISNHQSATSLADYYGIPFYYLPVTGTTLVGGSSCTTAHQMCPDLDLS